MPPDTRAGVTRRGLRLPGVPADVVDVFIGDHRVFSAAPAEFAVEGAHARLPWPQVLLPYLHGQARVVVKGHLDGRVLLDQPVRFGTSDDPVSIRDGDGRPLAVDKFGKLVRMFSGMEAGTAQQLASAAARLIEDVNAFGVGGFLAYGSLLGAVRNGRLIGHDTDLDIAYLSNHAHPAEVARESFALERFLTARGWSMHRLRVGLMRAEFLDEAGDERHVDVFTAMQDGSRFYLDKFVLGELDPSAILPQGTVELEGVPMPAPADPHRLLELTYGPSYLVPDPSFRYATPLSLQRTAWAWMGNYRYLRGRWQKRLQQDRPRPAGSPFARQVAQLLPTAATVIDIGCGRGSDTLSFARRGHRVVGLDYAAAPLARATRIARRNALPAEFRWCSLLDVRHALGTATDIAAHTDLRAVFSRNVIDVLEPEARANFWLTSRLLLLGGGSLHLQFRTTTDDQAENDPGFRPLDADRMVSEATGHGATVVFREDHRRVCRLELTWACAREELN